MPEDQAIEWKAEWKDEYLEWICGFANAQGGKIYIGCDDNGNVIGIKNANKLLKDIPNKVRSAMSIVVNINRLVKNGKVYLEIVVPPYPVPISCKGVCYYRSGSTMQTISGAELENFILQKRGVTWDNMPLLGFTINDIDDELIQKFKMLAAKRGRIDENILSEPKELLMERLHLTNAGYYTNAAMLLFGKNPDKWQLGAYTKIGYFKNDADLYYQDEIRGSILEQVDKIIEVLHLKYMKAKISYDGIQRIEQYIIPDDALREALLNALCHKQYDSCIPIQISVYDDCLYIANCGKLPDNWTIDNLISKHVSKPYNPSIANVFYIAGLIENWGRGIEKIYQTCKDNDSPVPEYKVNPGDIMICFKANKNHLINDSLNKVTVKVTDKTSNTAEMAIIKAFGEVTDRVTVKVTEAEKELLKLLSENPTCTYAYLANKLGVSRKTIATKIKSLRDKEIILRVGSDKKGYWHINL